jgi:succinate dehydrogenase flavin-adding protein (antitoxin of CptAB toxin-antitoxin module)
MRADFAALLELPDPQLAAWLLQGERPPDGGIAALVDDILRSRD